MSAGPTTGDGNAEAAIEPDWSVDDRRRFRGLFRDRSYILIEPNEGPPIAMFLETGESIPATLPSHTPFDRIRRDLSDPAPEVREEAVLSLVDLDPAAAMYLVGVALRDDDPEVRIAAEAVAEELGLQDHGTSDATDLPSPERPTR